TACDTSVQHWCPFNYLFGTAQAGAGRLPSAKDALFSFGRRSPIPPGLGNLAGLEEGQLVVAIPYVETGIAFGLANGIPEKWLYEVFRFAPAPTESFWLNGSPTPGSSSEGFLEFCTDVLPGDFLQRFSAHFVELQNCGKCKLLQL